MLSAHDSGSFVVPPQDDIQIGREGQVICGVTTEHIAKLCYARGTMRATRGRASADVRERLATEILVCDGAMGTMLHAGGVSLDRSLPELNISHADLVRSIHRAYIAAGADVIEPTTF